MGSLSRDRRCITPSSTSAASNADRTYCSACKVYLPNYEHFIFHILNSRNHFACDICHVDYHRTEALDRHNKQVCLVSLLRERVREFNLLELFDVQASNYSTSFYAFGF